MSWKLFAIVATLVFASAFGGYHLKAQAQQDPSQMQGQQDFPQHCTVVIPEEWGKYRGNATGSGLVFEDKNGTLRIIQQLPCTMDGTPNGPPRVFAEICRK